MAELKKLTWTEFLAEFDPEVQVAIVCCRRKDGVDGMVMLVNHVFDSSRFGDKTAMVYGPGCTFKSLEMITDQKGGVYTTGLPSSASFAEAYTVEWPPCSMNHQELAIEKPDRRCPECGVPVH